MGFSPMSFVGEFSHKLCRGTFLPEKPWESSLTRVCGRILPQKLVGETFAKKQKLQEGKSGGFCFQIRRSCGNESCLFLHPLPKKLKSFCPWLEPKPNHDSNRLPSG